MQSKELTVYRSDNLFRNIVRLLEKYFSLLPVRTKCSALYQYPATGRSLTLRTWYSEKPLGVNSIKKVVKNLAQKAGLEGNFSNHSLRATCATRLFEVGVDEQLIKNVTGHHSDSVRDYKRANPKLVSEAQKKVCAQKPAETVVKSAHKSPETDKTDRKRSAAFDIDEYEIPQESVSRYVNLEGLGSKSHKRSHCTGAEECNEMCEVMKKIDKILEKRKVKKLKLSLKYKRLSKK